MVKCLGAVSCDVNIIGKLIHGALNGYNVRGSVPPNSDDRTCFSKAFVSTTMLLYRIRYYFVAVIGFRDHVFMAQGLSACFATVQGLFLVLP